MTCPICKFELKSFPKSFLPGYKMCSHCTGHFIANSKKIVVKYSEKYFDEGKKYSVVSDILEIPLQRFLYMRVLYIKNILGAKKRVKVLDYGCGSGNLVKKLIDEGVETVGFEPSAGAIKIAQREKLPVYNKVKSTTPGYDLVMFWHSLEHTDNPLDVIKKTSKLLKKNGKILVGVPNSDSWNALFGKKKWFHYAYPLHKVHFNERSIKSMAEKAGLRVCKVDFFNPEYTLSGLIQTILNFIFPQDVLYSFVAHRRSTMPQIQIFLYAILSIFFVILFSPAILAIYLIELIYKKSDAMLITLCK